MLVICRTVSLPHSVLYSFTVIVNFASFNVLRVIAHCHNIGNQKALA